jgi:hypothetical protein
MSESRWPAIGKPAIRTMALWLLVAIAGSGCGGAVDVAPLPGTVDLNLLAGMRIPGAPSCAFLPIKTRTVDPEPLRQSVIIRCAAASATVDTTPRVTEAGAFGAAAPVERQARCRSEEKSGLFNCFVAKGIVRVDTQGDCANALEAGSVEAPCDDETRARELMTGLVELLSKLPESAPPDVEQPQLPKTIDLERLTRAQLPGAPPCSFAAKVRGLREPGTGQIGLRCGRHATASLSVAYGLVVPQEGYLQCQRKATDHGCALRHGSLTLRTSVSCRMTRRDRCVGDSNRLLARLFDFLATVPERACDPCGTRETPTGRVTIESTAESEGAVTGEVARSLLDAIARRLNRCWRASRTFAACRIRSVEAARVQISASLTDKTFWVTVWSSSDTAFNMAGDRHRIMRTCAPPAVDGCRPSSSW